MVTRLLIRIAVVLSTATMFLAVGPILAGGFDVGTLAISMIAGWAWLGLIMRWDEVCVLRRET